MGKELNEAIRIAKENGVCSMGFDANVRTIEIQYVINIGKE